MAGDSLRSKGEESNRIDGKACFFLCLPCPLTPLSLLFSGEKRIPCMGPKEKHGKNFGLNQIRFSAIVFFSGLEKCFLGELFSRRIS
jgi:hypothetical protein